MKRRDFTLAACGFALSGPLAAAPASKHVVELRYLRMRNTTDGELQRTTEFLANVAAPALARAGAGPVGFFTPVIGEGSPFILALASFPGLAEMETARTKQAADPEYRRGRDAYNSQTARGYERLDSSLLRCFDAMPAVELPPPDPARPPRIFELRTYESNNGSTLERKIKMFNGGEIAIFRRLGMRPVFFGETLFGTRMPSLTYMLSFDDPAARDQLWKAFGADPEWRKLSSQPGNADSEIVSNITNSILRPLPFSQIR